MLDEFHATSNTLQKSFAQMLILLNFVIVIVSPIYLFAEIQ